MNLGGDIPVIGHQHVRLPHGQAHPGADRLLPFAGGVGAQGTGALQIDRGAVEYPRQYHVPVEVKQHIALVQLRGQWGERRACGVDIPDGLDVEV